MDGVDRLIYRASTQGLSPSDLQAVAQRHSNDGIMKRAELKQVLRRAGIQLQSDEIASLISSSGAEVGAFVRWDRISDAWEQRLQQARSRSTAAVVQHEAALQRFRVRHEATQASQHTRLAYGFGCSASSLDGLGSGQSEPAEGADISPPALGGDTHLTQGGTDANSPTSNPVEDQISPPQLVAPPQDIASGGSAQAGTSAIAAALRARLPVRDVSARLVLLRKLQRLDGDGDGCLHLRELRSALSDLGVSSTAHALRDIRQQLAGAPPPAATPTPARSLRAEAASDSHHSSLRSSALGDAIDFHRFVAWVLSPAVRAAAASAPDVTDSTNRSKIAPPQPEHIAPGGHGIPAYEGSNAWRWLAGSSTDAFHSGPQRGHDTVQGAADATATCPAAQHVFSRTPPAGQHTGAPRAAQPSMPGAQTPLNLKALAAAHSANVRRRAPSGMPPPGGQPQVRPPWQGMAASQQRDARPPPAASAAWLAFASKWEAAHGSEGSKEVHIAAVVRGETAVAYARDASAVPPASPTAFKILKPIAAAPLPKPAANVTDTA